MEKATSAANEPYTEDRGDWPTGAPTAKDYPCAATIVRESLGTISMAATVVRWSLGRRSIAQSRGPQYTVRSPLT